MEKGAFVIMSKNSSLMRGSRILISIILLPQVLYKAWVELSNDEVIMMDYIYLLVLAWMIQIVISTFSKTEQELKDRDK